MSMDVPQLELYCKQLYESSNPGEAEKALVAFQDYPDALPICQQLLDRADSPYSQLLAATTLTKLITRGSGAAGGVTIQQRVEIRTYVLNYFLTRPLQNFVVQSLVTLLVKITKYGWFDSYQKVTVFKSIVEDVQTFLQGSVEQCVIGVQILSNLTSEMNTTADAEANVSFMKLRKVASDFRDQKLLDIFMLSCNLLSNARDNNKNLNFSDEAQLGLMTQVLRLASNCLSFDFIGTSADESTDELHTIQLPTTWRPIFLDMNTLKLFFELYELLPSRLSSLALTCLVQITSVRRSLLSNQERSRFLSALVGGVKNILETSHGFNDPENYHEFCRLLSRLKANYQLGELVNVDCYPEAIALIAKFTVQSLQMWQFAPNSVHYLLSLWQKMVGSIQFMKETSPHLLDRYTPEITRAYIASRIDSVAVVVGQGVEDPLDDLGTVQQQLEQLSVIGRCEYEKTCEILVSSFERSARTYQEILAQGLPPSAPELRIQEGQLTWLVYIIGAAIGARFTAPDDQDRMDGEMMVRILQLMSFTDSRLPQAGSERLELAIISALEQVRKNYIKEQTHKFYKRLSEVLGLNDESQLLSVIIRKIITNLKYWGHSETIIAKTLSLLNDLSANYACVRKLVNFDEIQFILNNHTSEHFSFLGTNVAVTEMRNRSMFYTSLGRLFLVDFNEDEERFDNFLLPITNAFESLGPLMLGNASYPPEEAKKALIGLSRDLRGLVSVFNTQVSYMMFFDWIYPDYTPILIRAIELWAHDPTVTTPVLKLFTELVNNRSQRIQFDVSTPKGILLFREASKAICAYGSRVNALKVPDDQEYALRLKGMSICFLMLKSILCGNYVNFGVFELYGDKTLDNVLKITIEMFLSIKKSNLQEYPKLSTAYYVLLEYLAQDHISFIASLEPHVFLYILETISDGLSGQDTLTCTGCCSTLDIIVTYIFKQLQSKVTTFPNSKKKLRRHADSARNDAFLKMVDVHSSILKNILATIFNAVMFEHYHNPYTMSRPLLGLILLYEDCFRQLRENVIRMQPVERQSMMDQWFEKLMEGVDRNLLTKNRNRFTQNLSMFRRDINDMMKQANFAAGTAGNNNNNPLNDMILA